MSYIVSTAVLMVAYQSDVGLGAGRQRVCRFAAKLYCYYSSHATCSDVNEETRAEHAWICWWSVSGQSWLLWSCSWQSTCVFLSGFQCCSSSLAPSIVSFICLFFFLAQTGKHEAQLEVRYVSVLLWVIHSSCGLYFCSEAACKQYYATEQRASGSSANQGGQHFERLHECNQW